MRCNDSKIGFENLYKTVLTKKRKLIKKGINHPCAKFDKVPKKRRKSEFLLWGKIGLVLIIAVRFPKHLRLVVLMEVESMIFIRIVIIKQV